MRLIRGVLLSLLMLSLMSGVSQAAYLADQDKAVSVTLAPSLLSTSGSTGQLTFETQEAVHDELTSTSGTSVDHYYTWIYINGEPVLAVDPVWVDAT